MVLAFSLSDYFLTPFYLLYHTLILAALILSWVACKMGFKKMLFLFLVLLFTFTVEAVAGYLAAQQIRKENTYIKTYNEAYRELNKKQHKEERRQQKRKHIWIYHVFNLFEYMFFCLYYISNCKEKRYRIWAMCSIPIFIAYSILVSHYIYNYTSMPALNINAEGLLLFIMYTHLLFGIDIDLRMHIYNHPNFWISAGVLMYFGGAFVFINLYRTMLNVNYDETLAMFFQVSEPLNIILYTFIITGLICLLRYRKYLAQWG